MTAPQRDLLGDIIEDLPAAAEALADLPEAWHERLAELTAWHADELARTWPDLAPAEVRRGAVRLTARLCAEVGGAQWYWPKTDQIERALRDLRIWAEHDGTRGEGRGIAGLARRYKLSENQIWAIIRQQRARHRARVQGQLDLGDP